MSDARGVAFSSGSACGSGSGKVSHVQRAMGMSEADARASIRLGWGRYTSEQALRDGLNAIKDAVRLQGGELMRVTFIHADGKGRTEVVAEPGFGPARRGRRRI